MIILPTPIGPARQPPVNAVLYGFDPQGGAYYKIGTWVWILKDDQWTVYGLVEQWPEPIVREE